MSSSLPPVLAAIAQSRDECAARAFSPLHPVLPPPGAELLPQHAAQFAEALKEGKAHEAALLRHARGVQHFLGLTRAMRRAAPVPPHDGHAHAQRRRRHPLHPGHARPRRAEHDADLHPGRHPAAAARARQHAPGRKAAPRRRADAAGHANPSRLTLDLPPEFVELCQADNVPPEVVLRGFIADVAGIMNWAASPRADGYSSNGSDERRMAMDYYERAGYSWLYRDET